MSDKKQLTLMSQFSIIRESPAGMSHHQQPPSKQQHTVQKTNELKFKIEPIGIQPEDDDDLETCPSRTRSSWPHQIVPWWKPADRFEKPPYSYATLIAHAILTSKDGRLTLSDIYKWISEAYPYYKRGQKGWQNSIRHNLSLNKKWFIKVDRRPTQAHPGKGGYWTLQMNMEKIFVDNLSQAGGHSRRHHDMGMYATQYYRSSSSSGSSPSFGDDDCQDDALMDQDLNQLNLCPNIHITRPEDYEAGGNVNKKFKSSPSVSHVISAPRIRNMTSQEKSAAASAATATTEVVVTPPKTDPKNFIIRFNPSTDSSSSTTHKRKKSDCASRPPPKSGKRRNPVEPGSSTAEEEGDDSAVDVESFDTMHHLSKKRKSTTTKVDTIITSASPNTTTTWTFGYPSTTSVSHHANTRPSDLIDAAAANSDILGSSYNNNDFWMYDEDVTTTDNTMLFTSEYPLLFDVDAQNILQGLQATAPLSPPVQQQQQHSDMKTVDLQFNTLKKNIHYPTENNNMFNLEAFSDPNSHLFISSDLSTYNLEQYVDFGATASMVDNQKPPSDVLLGGDGDDQDDSMMLNTYWPTTTEDSSCYMNYIVPSSGDNVLSTMP